MPIIASTTNYSQFKYIPGNRPFSAVGNLLDSIRKNNKLEYHPIHVDKNMYIIDGQHRLACAQHLGVPIYYVVDPYANIQDIANLNANMRAWTSREFTHLYASQNYEDYIFIEEMKNKYKFDYYFTIQACCVTKDMKIEKKRSTLIKEYKTGNLRLRGDKAKLDEELGKLKEILEYSKQNLMYKFCNVNFQHALLHVIRAEKYDHKNMLNKINENVDEFRSLFSSKDRRFIHDALRKIYNKKLRRNLI